MRVWATTLIWGYLLWAFCGKGGSFRPTAQASWSDEWRDVWTKMKGDIRFVFLIVLGSMAVSWLLR